MCSILNKSYSSDICRDDCDDVVGDEDNCCEYGMNYSDRKTLSLFDLV